MKLIVGLGNPGKLYSRTRHNLGALIVTALAKEYGAAFKKDSLARALYAKINNVPAFVLAQPLTYMNLSGQAVSALVKKYKINLKDLLVIYDDLDLEFGRFRLRSSGSSGGHRGVTSIIGELQSRDFWRLRLGLGRPADKDDIVDFVLAPFSKQEWKQLKHTIAEAVSRCREWLLR